MKKLVLALGATLALCLSAHASVLVTKTQATADVAALYDTYHDRETGFVFVKLPQGWSFVARESEYRSHAVFVDAATGFVFVELSSGWKLVRS